MKPEEYGDLTRRLSPVVAHLSGGEPLLRKGIAAIVKAIKQAGVKYAILVTNGVLLNESNYLQLPEAILLNTLKFFEQGCMSDCKAGIRFLVVMPDRSLVPCSLHRSKYAT